jgi:ABC-type spermidine/putrescine transport system permease subunit II
MKPDVKSMNSHEWLLGFPVLGKTLNQYFRVYSGRLWEVLKTTFWIAIATTMSLLVGQLH